MLMPSPSSPDLWAIRTPPRPAPVCVICAARQPAPPALPWYPRLDDLYRDLCPGHLVIMLARVRAGEPGTLQDLLEREITRTRTLVATWLPTQWAGRLVVVARGCRTLYWALTDGFEQREVAARLRVVWDRRYGERRAGTARVRLPERHRADRRRPAPSSWSTLSLVVVDQPRAGGL